MSGGTSCKCKERNDPEYRRANWRVVNLRCNYSAFNGYKWTRSEYSAIVCLVCHLPWRTKAGYVSSLPAYSHEEEMARGNLK